MDTPQPETRQRKAFKPRLRSSKYLRRAAHEGRTSREGSIWDSAPKTVFSTQHGDMTATEYYNKFKKFPGKWGYSVGDSRARHVCPSCKKDLEFDSRDRAFCANTDCERNGVVYNEGAAVPGVRFIGRVRGEPTSEWKAKHGPPPKTSHKRYMRAASPLLPGQGR